MASTLAPTWSTLTTHYAADIWPPLTPLAQGYYAQQGQLVTAARYLALPPASATAPFTNSAAARALVAAALPAAGSADETYAQYQARGAASAQPLLTVLMSELEKRGITLADFTRDLAAQGAEAYLASLLDPSFWLPVVTTWQQQVQQRVDAEGRAQRFLAAQPAPALRAVVTGLLSRLALAYPAASLNTLAGLPLNEVAKGLWNPAPTVDDQVAQPLLSSLQVVAHQVLDQNYPDAEQVAYLVAALAPELIPLGQALLLPVAGQPALTTVTELAAADSTGLRNRLLALPANHPVVYALAAWLRGAIQVFLAADLSLVPAPEPATPLAVRGQLLGTEEPLPGFTLRLTQVLASQAGADRPAGAVVTAPDGHFAFSILRDQYLDDNDAVAEAPISVRAAVYYPGQAQTDEPVLTLLIEPAADGTVQPFFTGLELSATETSAAVTSLRLEVPATLSQLLADNGLTTLADLRAAGGVFQLLGDELAADATTAQAARRLDGLAQFEVVSTDAALHGQVVDAGYYSPAQLLDSISQADFVARFMAADPANAGLQEQVTGFYQQVAAGQALSQTLGLLAAATPAVSTTGFAGASRLGVARFANVGQLADLGASGGGNLTAAFGPTTLDDTTAPTLPGTHLLDGFNPATPGQLLTPQASGQCDCPACRSAVSPTAYLTSLLKYAVQYVQTPVPAPTTNSGGAGSGSYPGAGGTGVNGGLLNAGQMQSISAADLQNTFLQPYCDLGLSCQAAEEPVCQYRLAIEVIQAYWRSKTPGVALTVAQARPYVEGVLEALLQALGTTLAELRATTDVSRAALASRLQLPVSLVSQLQEAFSVTQLRDGRSLDEVEADLAKYFGLASTAQDPLRTGQLLTPVAPTNAIQLVRWNLLGLDYGLNTDADGQLCLTITPAGSQPHVTVYAGRPAEDNVVARGTLLESSGTTHTFAGLLYPQHGSGLSGSLVATITGGDAATFTLAVVPAVTAGRQQVLAAKWLREDAADVALLRAHQADGSVSWNGFTFLVDPDQLGPDDFRVLDSRRSPALGNRAYQLWRRRYEFLQYQLAPGLLALTSPNAAADALTAIAAIGGLGTLLDKLPTHSLTYSGDSINYVQIPWVTKEFNAYQKHYQPASGTETLALLYADCAGNTAAAPLAADALLSVGLSVEAMRRLYDLWQLNRIQPLSVVDLQEALDIVRQSVKKRFEADWTSEEQQSQNDGPVELNTRFFQSSLHEPQAGIWDAVRPAAFGLLPDSLPRIDPDEVTPLGLPDASYNDSANQLWSARQAELLQKRQAILASGTGTTTAQLRADAMLRYAYQANRFASAPATLLPGTPPATLVTLEDVVAVAQSSGAALGDAAQTYLNTILALRPDEATRLVDLRAQVLTQPADTLWQEMAALLTLAWKRTVAYRLDYVAESTPAPAAGASPTLTVSWRAQEGQVPNLLNSPLDYLTGTRKHRLVKWRADAATRAQWVQTLRIAGQRPLIDPDQLVPGDFHQAGERSRDAYSPAPATKPYLNPAFDLYQRRAVLVAGWLTSLQSSWDYFQGVSPADRLTWSWQLIAQYTYSTQAELEELYRQQHAGVDVSAALRRLLLTPDGLDLLVTQANGQGPDRATEVPHLLVQLKRQRQYAAWSREEIALRIVPAPYYFREPQAESESMANQPWRSSAVERRQWQRTLAARFAQAETLTAAQRQAVKAAEDQYLGVLRDALLMTKVGAAGDSLATRAAFMEDRYLLDFQTVCCQHTTRVAQASTVLQKLFTNVRDGLSSNDLTLSLDDATFESDWQWLSSYERWRSLMFLYLYPQNVLLPALKPGQTSQFRQTVSTIRAAASTSAADARGYMDDYQAYLTNINSLMVVTTTQTLLSPTATDGFTLGTTQPEISLQVALGTSYLAYANLHYLSASNAAQNTYGWLRVPGDSLVERVVGSAVYQPVGQDRYVYLFAFLREQQKDVLATSTATLYLASQRFNLRTLSWDDDYIRLDLTGTGTPEPRNVLVASGADETWPPIVTGLRNRVTPLYTEYPFSLPTYGPGYTDRVDDIIGKAVNVDLFYATLDAQGKSFATEHTNTIFLVSDLTLLSCLRLSSTRLAFGVGVQVGIGNPTVLNMFSLNVTSAFTDKYIISERLALFAASTPQQNAGSIGYSTPVFSSSWLAVYFARFLAAIQNIAYGSTAFSITTTMTSPTVNTYVTEKQLVLADAGVPIQSAGVHLDALLYNSTSAALNFYTATYFYNTVTYGSAGTTFSTKKVQVTSSGQYASDTAGTTTFPGDYFPDPTNAITTLSDVLTFTGPVMRSGYGPAQTPVTAYSLVNRADGYATIQTGNSATVLHQSLPSLPPLFSSLGLADQSTRRTALATVQLATPLNTAGYVPNLVSEAYYALPMLLAQELTRGRNYELALHYYRLVYDYTRVALTGTPDDKRLIYPVLASTGTATYDTVLDWLTNPNNPYTLAALRPNAHLDYVVMSVVRCLLAYADDEFTRDTAESVDRARTLYELADQLLQQDVTQYAVPGTSTLLDPLDTLFPAEWLVEWQSLKAVLTRVNQRAVLEQVLHLTIIAGASHPGLIGLFGDAQTGAWTWPAAFDQAWQLVNGQLDALPGGYLSLCAPANSAAAMVSYSLPVGLPAISVRPYVPFLPNTAFCVPTNPVPYALALRTELNLFKIRSCRNIAGVQRELDPYSAATDNTTGLPTLSSTGQLVRSTRLVVPATPFRYSYIMERARNLVALAQQTESSLLSALEKRDAEAYNQLKARQDISVSQATVQLQSLRVTEAEDGMDLAGLQLERSEIMENQYEEWISGGLNEWENAQMHAIELAGALKAVAALAAGADYVSAITSFGGTVAAAVANAAAAIADTAAQINGLKANYQRREQEWKFQRNLAAQDIKINQQQIKISNDQLKITGQEKRISQLQLDHATAVLNFLTTKFTNAELYDWMSGILQSAYGYFLQQATATARLAEQQLAFERQQVPAGIVQEDYYSDPTDDLTSASVVTSSGTTGRKGLTGSVRLLEDLTRLDEYAFETTRRKLQLSKTISLAQSFPTEFGRFRDTGVVAFTCQPEWFDQDFPGQYLRVLRRVRTSVIALVPPVDGIKARLSTAGTSHVTVDGAPFQTLALPRAQEAVALTSPSNATGLFELDQQSSELLLPFEGLGVDVPWTFSMQPASNPNLDYSAVADVLITLDYSALESADYARQVVQQLGTDRQQQVVLSLRDRFADQWYDLHHADEVAPAQQYVSTLTLSADDLPRSLRGVRVSQVSLFVDAPLDDDLGVAGAFADRSHLELRLTRGTGLGGAAFTNQYGLISTRTGTGAGPLYTGNAGALVQLIGTTPAGDWTLAVGPGRLRDRLAAGLVNDIYLILEVEGDVPAYVL